MAGLEGHRPSAEAGIPAEARFQTDLNSPSDSGPQPDAPLDSDSALQLPDDTDSPTPRSMQSDQDDKKWQWLPYPAQRTAKSVVAWARGPPEAQPYRIKPLFPVVQEYPLRLAKRILPKRRYRRWLLFFYLSIWLVAFVLIKRQETASSEIAGWGQPQTIGCGVSYWDAGNACGLDGNDCRPFSNSGFAFRCPANCGSYRALNPKAVGDQEVIYRPLIVGGPPGPGQQGQATYRGDSYICGSAIHAGLISDRGGGCGVVQLVGQRENYVGSRNNGIGSIGFDSYFPRSFQFLEGIRCSSSDMRWSLLALSVVFTALLSLFTASPAVFFFSSFVGLYWTVGMALDSPPSRTLAGLFSTELGKFLPAMFCAWVMYDKMGIRRTLAGLTAQVEKTVLWLGACWVGGLNSYTFGFIPIQRLTAHDLNQQPGAKAALAIIIMIVIVIVATQVWFFRKEGRLISQIKLYALFLAGIVIALLLPGLQLRLHHYILALLFLPGTSLQMRPSLVYQGLLVGLFINGIARWGFDPVLQTSSSLQGDAQQGSLLPIIPTPTIGLGSGPGSRSNITFSWEVPAGRRYDGISILVNDVERFRTYFDEADAQSGLVWYRNTSLGLPEYFRFALMDGSLSGDYTKAGTWTAAGEWREMSPGASKRKVR